MEVLEEWRDVVGYSDYEVSNLGRVRSLKLGKIKYRKSSKSKYGYICIGLHENGKMKNFRVHRLVWESFRGPIPLKYEIDHVNGKRDDNRLSNLRCVTSRENKRNPITAERLQEAGKRRLQNQEWRNNQRDGVRKALSKPVLQLDKVTSEVIRRWESMRDVERELGIGNSRISACCRGKKKSAGGYRWCFCLDNAS